MLLSRRILRGRSWNAGRSCLCYLTSTPSIPVVTIELKPSTITQFSTAAPTSAKSKFDCSYKITNWLLLEMLKLVSSGDPRSSWKAVLIMDKVTVKVMSSACKMTDITDQGVSYIAHRLEMVRIMLQKLHCNVFMLSYRGYGASDGFPSEQGITMDVQAALDHLSQRTDINTSQIVVFRRSLGGAVGAVVTKNNPDKVAALILENTFSSILYMAGVILPFFKYFIGVSSSTSKNPKFLNFVVRSQWSTIDVIGQVLNFLHLEEHLGVRMCQLTTTRVEIGDFVEYDLDNEDEDWLQDFNKERLILPAENISRSRGPMIMTLIVFEDIDATLYEDRGEPGRLQTQQILGNHPITHKEVELKAIKVPSVII
ncbi:hypothetical protein L2E82_38728 [Cichorium intybus]|uniref:Uncharacterized protein n=1 Tax=Cichorium intybus TaxID=13427 RepID=A0ACB9AGD8_CICIN|nr:hypothetical protein L2E82_38728 [Cichorium intybus]